MMASAIIRKLDALRREGNVEMKESAAWHEMTDAVRCLQERSHLTFVDVRLRYPPVI
jgi:hypothetical protein